MTTWTQVAPCWKESDDPDDFDQDLFDSILDLVGRPDGMEEQLFTIAFEKMLAKSQREMGLDPILDNFD